MRTRFAACTAAVALTAIVAALIARHKVVVYDVREVPTCDEVHATDYFPLSVGNRWTYEGTAINATTSDTAVVEKPVRISMAVERVVRKGEAAFFIMRGHPADAAWALKPEDRGKRIVTPPPSRYGYLVISNKIFLVGSGDIARVLDGLENDSAFLVTVNDLVFEFPLFSGQRIGDPAQFATSAWFTYYWRVGCMTETTESARDNLPSVRTYELTYRTNPDYTEVWFVPYVGITRWSYRHRGTPAEVTVSLTGCKTHPRD